jgi:hypothetical protein
MSDHRRGARELSRGEPVAVTAGAATPAVTTHLRIVIPTRNRAELAIAAAGSVFAAGLPHIDVWVSDNSTTESERERLDVGLPAGVTVIRPPSPLPMAEHWDWAIGQALADPIVSHLAILTDRMIFQGDGLRVAAAVATAYPDRLVTYAHDTVNDHEDPITLEQVRWSDRVVEIDGRELLRLSAQANHWLLEAMLPRLLNGITPRSVFDEVLARFGATAGRSISPDFAFAFRALACGHGVVHVDRPVLLSYANDRSNGTAAASGRSSTDHADFLATMPHRLAGPLGDQMTIGNAILHEYLAAANSSFPPIDRTRLLNVVAADVGRMSPGPARSDLEASLAELGASIPPSPVGRSRARRVAGLLADPRRAVRRVAGLFRPAVGSSKRTIVSTSRGGLEEARRSPRPSSSGLSAIEVAAESGCVSVLGNGRTIAGLRR